MLGTMLKSTTGNQSAGLVPVHGTALPAIGGVNLYCVDSVHRKESSQHPLFAPLI